jgi:uncharacterized membrane protein
MRQWCKIHAPPGAGLAASMSMKTPNGEPPVNRNVQAIVDLERKALDERPHISRLSDLVLKVAASPTFVIVHLIVFAGWMVLNSTPVAFDRRPFNLLNLILAIEAIVLTSIVLNAQADLRRMADLRAHLDLQVNILAEQELTAMLGLLNRICDRLGIDAAASKANVEQLSKETDVRTIATAIEKTLDESPG